MSRRAAGSAGPARLSRRAFGAGALAFGAGATLPVRLDDLRAAPGGGYAGLAPAPAAPAGRLREITLDAAVRRVSFAPGEPELALWTYAPEPFPIVRLARGDSLRATVLNRLDEHISVHWHGLRIANAMDGVQYLTQPPIRPGERFVYEFTPPDAGTFFFHPHCNESGQVGRGLAGILIVEGDERRRPDAEVVVAVKDWRIAPDGGWLDFSTPAGASRAGTFGTQRSANGRKAFTAIVPAEGDIRVRLLNLDSTRVMEIGIEGASAAIIAVDGHAVAPIAFDRRGLETWKMGPAMRLDLLVRAPRAGGSARIIDYFSAEPWTAATLTAAAPAPKTRRRFDPHILYRPVVPEPDLTAPERLAFAFSAASGSIGSFGDGLPPDDPLAKVLLDSICVTDRTYWSINRLSWPNAADPRLPPPLATLKAGRTYVLELMNATPHPHPIHLHGHVFRVISSSRQGLPVFDADTVLLSPKERVEIAFVAAPGDWMFHCHILEHLETGMMGYLRVA